MIELKKGHWQARPIVQSSGLHLYALHPMISDPQFCESPKSAMQCNDGPESFAQNGGNPGGQGKAPPRQQLASSGVEALVEELKRRQPLQLPVIRRGSSCEELKRRQQVESSQRRCQ